MEAKQTRILVIGAGIAGIAVGSMLRRRGITDFTIIDRGRGFGGTWRDNVYPGVECDVQSHLYSYSFRKNPRWSKTYAKGSEINDYLVTVAEEEGLSRHAEFERSVTDIRWDAESNEWVVATDHGPYRATFVITATGTLAEPKMADLDGIGDFRGQLMHSALWDSRVSLAGKRVAVIGTGASAIQVVPAIADEVETLTVFQRTPPWIAPRVDTHYSEAQKRTWEDLPDTLDDYRQFLFWFHEGRFPERARAQSAIDRMTAIAETHRKSQVNDPGLEEATRPNYAIGCKRILLSNNWYPTLEREDVELVPHAADRLSAKGIIDSTGVERAFDVVIVCSGYDTTTLPISQLVTGENGVRLAELWNDGGAQSYGGITVDGFPNFFFINGPQTGLGFGSMIYMIETQSRHVCGALEHALAEDADMIQVRPERQKEFTEFIDARAKNTVWLTGGCDSFYLADGSGRLTTLWPDFMTRYSDDFGSFNPDDYRIRTKGV